MTGPTSSRAYQSHAETSARLLTEVVEDDGDLTEMERWERLTMANTHAMLAIYEGNQQGLALMTGYREDLAEALTVDRERLEMAKRAEERPAVEPSANGDSGTSGGAE